MTKAPAVTLPEGFSECERGNVLLIGEEGELNAYVRLSGGVWLETTLRLNNYPSFTTGTFKATDAELVGHIRQRCQGMYVRKMNVDGWPADLKRVPYTDE